MTLDVRGVPSRGLGDCRRPARQPIAAFAVFSPAKVALRTSGNTSDISNKQVLRKATTCSLGGFPKVVR